MKRTALLLAAIPAILSCSIKEDRAGCPCELTVVLAEAGGRDGEDLTLGISGLSDERIPGARIPEKVEKTVVFRLVSSVGLQIAPGIPAL